jgi:hypothetical protein
MTQAKSHKPDTLHLPPKGGALDLINDDPPLLHIVSVGSDILSRRNSEVTYHSILRHELKGILSWLSHCTPKVCDSTGSAPHFNHEWGAADAGNK